MKLAVTIAVIIFLQTASLAQAPCNMGLNDAPAVFGLKLAMPLEQVRGVLGRDLKIKPNRSGEGSFFQNFIDQPAPSSLVGVRALFLRYFKNKIYQIEIFYEDKDKPTKLEDLINRLSADLQLPAAAWNIKNGIAEMNCSEFLLVADTILNPHIEITDDVAYQEFKTEKEQQQPAKKKRKSKEGHHSDGTANSSNSIVSPLGRM